MSVREDGAGAIAAMNSALADAGVEGGDVWSVNAHATSTPLGDKAEAGAIAALCGEQGGGLVTSNKGGIGHLLGAAGAVEAVFSVMSVAEGVVPPTINCHNIDPDIAKLGLNIVRAEKVTTLNLRSSS